MTSDTAKTIAPSPNEAALGSTPAATPSPRTVLGHACAWIAILAAMIFMLHAGWERWNDPIIDFGREAYLPWQITQGKVLYRDVESFNGPLSPYLNAVWFKLFGVSLHTLVYCNIAISLAIVVMLYRIALVTAGNWAALASSLTFVFISGYSQFETVGNRNYLAPYSHEATHGIALSLAALLLMHRFLARPSAARLAATGFFVGLVFLTKVEIFVAITIAVSAAWTLHVWLTRPALGDAMKQLGVFFAAAAAVPIVACMVLALAMPFRDALLGALGSIHYSFNSQLTHNAYFAEVSGLADPSGNFLRALMMTAGIAAVLGGVALIAWRTRGPIASRVIVGAAVFFIVAGTLRYRRDSVPWDELSRSLTIWVALIAIGWAVVLIRARRAATPPVPPLDSRAIFAAAWTAFAAAMLMKMVLNVRLNHYGFALAMPALTLFAAALFGWWPDFVARKGGSAAVMRLGAAGAMVMMIAVHVSLSNSNHAVFDLPFGAERDRFFYHRAGTRATDFSQLLADLATHTRANDTIAVLPEGVMANFLLRRANPTPYTFFEPPDVIMFGEQKMIASFEAHPPDYVVLIHQDATQYGAKYFGRDYAQTLYAWVLAHYHEQGSIGPPPFSGDDGGILILARNP